MKSYILLLIIGLTMIMNLAATDHTIIPVTTKPPEENKIYPIAIIGAGAAGTMAAKRAVLNNNEVLLFIGAKQEQRRSRGYWVRKVDNIPGFARYERTILELRNETLLELTQHPLGHQLHIIENSVQTLEKETDYFKLSDGAGKIYYAKHVVLATGMMDEQPQIQGTIRPILKYANGQTVLYCSVCDGHRSLGKKTAVIGYSESAASIALLLMEKYQPTKITILTNGHPHQFDSDLLKRLQTHNIDIIEAPIQEVLGNKETRQLTGFKMEAGNDIDVEIGFVALGIRPNNQLALQLGTNVDDKGLVITDANGESSVPHLFVIGDLRANSMKQIYTAWQHAVDSLQVINRRMRESSKEF
jgi:thioredoxin reductase (NADPH)